MSINKQRENSGILFRNDKKQSDNSPDYTGVINCDGVEYQLSSWVKQGQKGKFLSPVAKPKDNGDSKQVERCNDLHRES